MTPQLLAAPRRRVPDAGFLAAGRRLRRRPLPGGRLVCPVPGRIRPGVALATSSVRFYVGTLVFSLLSLRSAVVRLPLTPPGSRRDAST